MTALTAIAVGVGSCNDPRIYNHYEHTLLNGWERNDTLFYEVPPVKEGGKHREWVELRVHKEFPFKSLTLILTQTVYTGKRNKSAQKRIETDTINCPIMNEDGLLTGKRSLNFSEIRTYLREIELREGDSIRIAIIHHMRQEIIPGLSDVGIEITQ